MQLASLIICTYNRSLLLKQVLDSLLKLIIPELLDWEILVIDNNSKDRTKELVASYGDKLPLKYIFEPKQGKTHALNRALDAARGELLLFTDDDTVVHQGWASAFLRAAEEFQEAGWFGGRCLPLWEREKPLWLSDEALETLSGYFCLYDLGDIARPYRTGDLLPLGASMAIRKRTIDIIGQFREDLGPRGTERGVGDDTELIRRAIDCGIQGYYVPEASLDHFVPETRLALMSFLRYGMIKGADQFRMAGPNALRGSYMKAASQLLRSVPQFLKIRTDNARICFLNAGMELGRLRAEKNIF